MAQVLLRCSRSTRQYYKPLSPVTRTPTKTPEGPSGPVKYATQWKTSNTDTKSTAYSSPTSSHPTGSVTNSHKATSTSNSTPRQHSKSLLGATPKNSTPTKAGSK